MTAKKKALEETVEELKKEAEKEQKTANKPKSKGLNGALKIWKNTSVISVNLRQTPSMVTGTIQNRYNPANTNVTSVHKASYSNLHLSYIWSRNMT